jgi:hypothetical protein
MQISKDLLLKWNKTQNRGPPWEFFLKALTPPPPALGDFVWQKLELPLAWIFNPCASTTWPSIKFRGPVTKTENIKTDATKILRPTLFSD